MLIANFQHKQRQYPAVNIQNSIFRKCVANTNRGYRIDNNVLAPKTNYGSNDVQLGEFKEKLIQTFLAIHKNERSIEISHAHMVSELMFFWHSVVQFQKRRSICSFIELNVYLFCWHKFYVQFIGVFLSSKEPFSKNKRTFCVIYTCVKWANEKRGLFVCINFYSVPISTPLFVKSAIRSYKQAFKRIQASL